MPVSATRFPGAFLPLILLLLTVLIPPSPAQAQPPGPLKKATLMLPWTPQAQFAGYYVAKETGIYRAHGIDLTITPGGADRSPVTSLRDGKADFAVLWLSTALQQSGRVKLVNLAQIVQKTSMMLVARKSSGIKNPEGLKGKKVGVWEGDSSLPARAFLAKYGLRVREVPLSRTVNLFLRGGIDVTCAMRYNEYHTILNSGVNPDELELFVLHDHGIRFAEDGLYTLEKNYRKDPALADSFVEASLEGWRYAFEHPDQAVDIVLRQMEGANIPASRAHQKWMLETMREVIQYRDKGGAMGRLLPSDYEAVAASLKGLGLVGTVPRYDEFVGRKHVSR